LLVDRNSSKSGLSDVRIKNGPSAATALRRGVDSGLYLQLMNLLREDIVDASLLPEDLTDAFKKYLSLLDEHRYLDYSQILFQAVTLLEGDGAESAQLRSQI